MVYLDGGMVLKIYEAGIKDYANETSTTLYLLTKQDIEVLKKSNILSVRYTTKCSAGAMDPSCDETFIASNKDVFGSVIQHTPHVIKELFEDCYVMEGVNESGERVMNYVPKKVSENLFEECAIGLTVKGKDRYISLILRDMLANMDQQSFTDRLEINLLDGTQVMLNLINSQSQNMGGSKVIMGVYYLQPSDYDKFTKSELKSIRFSKLSKGWQNGEKTSQESIIIAMNKKVVTNYMNCSLR